jgi:hypothetical protein
MGVFAEVHTDKSFRNSREIVDSKEFLTCFTDSFVTMPKEQISIATLVDNFMDELRKKSLEDNFFNFIDQNSDADMEKLFVSIQSFSKTFRPAQQDSELTFVPLFVRALRKKIEKDSLPN